MKKKWCGRAKIRGMTKETDGVNFLGLEVDRGDHVADASLPSAVD